MEDCLRASGLLGTTTPKRFLSTVVYLLGVNLGLRAGEHRKLRRSMFQVSLMVMDA